MTGPLLEGLKHHMNWEFWGNTNNLLGNICENLPLLIRHFETTWKTDFHCERYLEPLIRSHSASEKMPLGNITETGPFISDFQQSLMCKDHWTMLCEPTVSLHQYKTIERSLSIETGLFLHLTIQNEWLACFLVLYWFIVSQNFLATGYYSPFQGLFTCGLPLIYFRTFASKFHISQSYKRNESIW